MHIRLSDMRKIPHGFFKSLSEDEPANALHEVFAVLYTEIQEIAAMLLEAIEKGCRGGACSTVELPCLQYRTLIASFVPDAIVLTGAGAAI